MNALILSEPLKALEPSGNFSGLSFKKDFRRIFFRSFYVNEERSGLIAWKYLKTHCIRILELIARRVKLSSFMLSPEKSAVGFDSFELRRKGPGDDFQGKQMKSPSVEVDGGLSSAPHCCAACVHKEFQHVSNPCSDFLKDVPTPTNDFHSLLLSMIKFCLTPLFSHRLEKAPSQVKTMTTKENLLELVNAVAGLMFLAVLVTVCLAMAAAPVAVFIWLVYLMLKFLGVFA